MGRYLPIPLWASPLLPRLHLGASRGAVTLRGHGSAPARASGAGPRPAWARSDSSEGLRASWCGFPGKVGPGPGPGHSGTFDFPVEVTSSWLAALATLPGAYVTPAVTDVVPTDSECAANQSRGRVLA
jgi:hypothetical protein